MTNPVPNTRINAVDQIESALRMLSAYGYDTTPLWKEHNDWLATLEQKTLTDADRQWATQLPEPSTITEHFENGQAEVLTAARCHVGRQYSLSPGQRDVLRERYGLTPTMTVVVTNVELFETEDVIWSITLKSTEHVDPKRKHVLNEVVLCPAREFFMVASIKDAERVKELKEKAPRESRARSIAAGYVST